MTSTIVIAVVALILNILDSVTTHLCFKQYPDKELKGEANPIMRLMMLKNRFLAEFVKHVGLLGLVIWLILNEHTETLRLLVIMFSLVVLNNAYIVISRAIAKRKLISPFKALTSFLHIPKSWHYVVIVVIITILAAVINLLWR